jgi:hypothetical protein
MSCLPFTRPYSDHGFSLKTDLTTAHAGRHKRGHGRKCSVPVQCGCRQAAEQGSLEQQSRAAPLQHPAQAGWRSLPSRQALPAQFCRHTCPLELGSQLYDKWSCICLQVLASPSWLHCKPLALQQEPEAQQVTPLRCLHTSCNASVPVVTELWHDNTRG